jgi:hypothetical protein
MVRDGAVRPLSNIGLSRTLVGRVSPGPVTRIPSREMVERVLNSDVGAHSHVATPSQSR